MNNLPPATEYKHSGSVLLTPPGLITWLNQYKLLYSVLLGPLILIGLSLYHSFSRDFLQFASAMAIVLILLLNGYFYLIRKRKEAAALSIWIDLDEIQMLKKGVVLYRDALKNLLVMQPEHQISPNAIPRTLLIEGKHFPRIFIGSTHAVHLRPAAEKIDFCVTSQKEWLQLLQALAGCNGLVYDQRNMVLDTSH